MKTWAKYITICMVMLSSLFIINYCTHNEKVLIEFLNSKLIKDYNVNLIKNKNYYILNLKENKNIYFNVFAEKYYLNSDFEIINNLTTQNNKSEILKLNNIKRTLFIKDLLSSNGKISYNISSYRNRKNTSYSHDKPIEIMNFMGIIVTKNYYKIEFNFYINLFGNIYLL